MSVIVSFTPALEAKLLEHAAAAGKDVGTFVREAVEEKLSFPIVPAARRGRWAIEFDLWMHEVAVRASDYPKDFVVDDSRESIYQGRGE